MHSEEILGFETLKIKDLGALKAFARCQRSKIKDIVDIAEILQHQVSLQDIISTAEQIFGYDFSAKEFLNATQVLNYGHVDEIQSLFKVYSQATIRSVLENPVKGVWSPKTYKAFCNLLNVVPQKKAINILFVEKHKKINKLFSALFSLQL